jgi:tetratricopeptide (TPR) repeat protein
LHVPDPNTTPIVDDVMEALAGPAEGGDRSADNFREHVERAEAEFDVAEVARSIQALVQRLGEDPTDLRALESLIVLGLAHPDALEHDHVPLGQEGKRLAVLFEHRGEHDRAHVLLEMLSERMPTDKRIGHQLASMLRRNGKSDHLLDRYLTRANEAVAANRPQDAIQWLQEALLVDRSRRDIARMIRDLRFQIAERRTRSLRGVRRALIACCVVGVLSAVVWWERRVETAYSALPAADVRDLASLRERLAALDGLMDTYPLWLGMWRASGERADLRVSIQKVVAEQAEAERVREEEHARSLAHAESANLRGDAHMDNGEFMAALDDYRECLSVAPPDWPNRARVEANIAAIEQWRAQHESPDQ